MMLDVLEDYLRLGGHPFERIDGSTSSRDRQAAIDRFSKGGWGGLGAVAVVAVRVTWLSGCSTCVRENVLV
jgi:superfamily II DNA or RNA helicase